MDNSFALRQIIGGSARLGLALAVGLPLLQACAQYYLPEDTGPDVLAAGLVPENLRSCVLSNEQINKGLRYLPLSADVEALWNDAWSKFRAGA